VLFVSHKHPPSIGGMETHNFHLKVGLEKEFNLIPIVIAPNESRISFFWKVRKRMISVLNQHHTDFVYVNDGLLAIIAGSLKESFPDTQFIATIHGLEATFPSSFYQQRLLTRLRYYDKLICVSNFTKGVLDKINVLSGKTYCILNGIDHNTYVVSEHEKCLFEEKYSNISGRRILLSVGRPVKRKGFSWFATEVLPHLENDPVYIVAGPLPSDESTYKWRKKLLPETLNHLINLAFGYAEDSWSLRKIENKNLVLTGSVSYPELNFLIDKCDLFIVPNILVDGDAEGFGLVALEGAIRGKIVLAADIQGLKDAISHHNNGIKIQSGDALNWIKICNDLLSKTASDHLTSHQIKSYTIDNYSWNKMVKEYIALFKT
jgi:phosphatidylinositol alpha-1,6-mannosyltransferase